MDRRASEVQYRPTKAISGINVHLFVVSDSLGFVRARAGTDAHPAGLGGVCMIIRDEQTLERLLIAKKELCME